MSTLRQIATDVWTLEGPLALFGLCIGHQMTVVRRSNGSLLVHSPLPCTPELLDELRALGPIEDWVAPSRTHDLYLEGWFEQCPEARAWGAPSLARVHPDWGFAGWLDDCAHAPWADEFAVLPVDGVPRVDEHVLLHRPSSTAICADLIFNCGDRNRGLRKPLAHLVGIGGGPAADRLYKLMIRDRAAFRASLEPIRAWGAQRLIVGHGDPVEGDVGELLTRAYRLG
jgi:hypothetical protein